MGKYPFLIHILGKPRQGKDVLARKLQVFFREQGMTTDIFSFGDALKQEAFSEYLWDGKKDEKGRSLLQKIGQEKRDRNKNYWEIKVHTKIIKSPSKIIILPDTRYRNELVYFEKYGYERTTVRIERTGYESILTLEQTRHPSEKELENYKTDYIVQNDSTLDGLTEKARKLGAEIIQTYFRR